MTKNYAFLLLTLSHETHLSVGTRFIQYFCLYLTCYARAIEHIEYNITGEILRRHKVQLLDSAQRSLIDDSNMIFQTSCNAEDS